MRRRRRSFEMKRPRWPAVNFVLMWDGTQGRIRSVEDVTVNRLIEEQDEAELISNAIDRINSGEVKVGEEPTLTPEEYDALMEKIR